MLAEVGDACGAGPCASRSSLFWPRQWRKQALSNLYSINTMWHNVAPGWARFIAHTLGSSLIVLHSPVNFHFRLSGDDSVIPLPLAINISPLSFNRILFKYLTSSKSVFGINTEQRGIWALLVKAKLNLCKAQPSYGFKGLMYEIVHWY